jgi:hypothetical protein
MFFMLPSVLTQQLPLTKEKFNENSQFGHFHTVHSLPQSGNAEVVSEQNDDGEDLGFVYSSP